MAQKFHFAILQIEVTRASRGLSVIAELLVQTVAQKRNFRPTSEAYRRIYTKWHLGPADAIAAHHLLLHYILIYNCAKVVAFNHICKIV